jgi:rhodanese-related sulfurtransferase
MCGYNTLRNGTMTYCPPLVCDAEPLKMHNPTVWKLLVRRDFILSNNVFFPENVVSDDVVSILWFALTDRYCTIPNALYYWVHHDASESHSQPYRYCQTLPDSFIQFSRYGAYQQLPAQKKRWISIILALHLYNSALVSIMKLPDKLLENSKLIVEALEIFQPPFTHEVFAQTAFGERVASTLQYIHTHIEETDFSENLIAFHNQLDEELKFKNTARELQKMLVKKTGAITVWGAGVRGKRMAKLLSEHGYHFELTDKNPDVHGTFICGIMVKPWEELINTTDLVIVSPLQAFTAVKKQIDSKHITIIDMSSFRII